MLEASFEKKIQKDIIQKKELENYIKKNILRWSTVQLIDIQVLKETLQFL